MKNFAFLTIFLTTIFLMNGYLNAQQFIIVGPQNDCANKNKSRNIHTNSEWFDVSGVSKLKINTLQHRTYDKSRIYNSNGVLIWKWDGESYKDTWYRKEHFLDINTKKIKVEFTQGYSDPFCNGFVKVEKFSFDFHNNNNQDFSENTSISLNQFSEALNLFYESYKGAMKINSDVFDPMKLLIERGSSSFKLKGRLLEQYQVLSGFSIGGPSSYGDDKDWRLLDGSIGDNPRFTINYDTVLTRFKNSLKSQLAPECKECKTLIKKYYSYYKNKTILSNIEFNELKNKVQKCMNQRSDKLSKRINNKLLIMSGGVGGPSTYGDDKNWRLTDLVGRRLQLPYEKNKTNSNGDYIVKYENKFGVCDNKGYLFIETIYDKIENFEFKNDIVYKVEQQNKVGLINYKGDYVLTNLYEKILDIMSKDSILIVKKNGNWGHLKSPFKNFVKIDAENIYLNGSLKIIESGGKKGVLNIDGSIGINPIYDELFSQYMSATTSKTLINARKGSKYGLIDDKFNIVLPIEYDQIGCIAGPSDRCSSGENKMFKPRYIPIYINNKMGYFDAEENLIKIEPIFDDIKGLGIFNYGLEIVSIANLNGKFGLISNNTGKSITSFKYDEIKPFIYDNLNAYVKINKKFGVISIDGKELINCIYDSISDFDLKGFSKLFKSDKLGLVNWKNKDYTTLIEPQFNELSILDSKFILTRINNKYGIVNLDCKELIFPYLDEIKKSDDNGYSIKLNNKWGYLNSEGALIVSPMFDSQFKFKDNIAQVSLNGLSFEIDKSGNRFKSYTTIGDLDIYYKDVSVSNYYGALSTCEELGNGWRLPNSEELEIIYNNIDLISNLTTEFKQYNENQGYNTIKSVDAAIYWGENARSLCLRKSAIGFGKIWDKASTYGQETWFYSVRPVRINHEMKKKRQDTEDAYAKYVLSQISFSDIFNSISRAEKKISSSNKNYSNNKSNNNSTKKCIFCKPNDDKGWYITDYDYVKRLYLNGRYIKNIGHKPCPTCQGQGTYKRNDSSGEILTCYTCHGDRWIECDKCKGTGE